MIYNDAQLYAVARILAGARGVNGAVTIDELTNRAGITERRITETLLEERWADFPFVLVSGAAGIYQPAEAEDLNRFVHSQRSRALKCFLKAKRTVRKAVAHGWKREGRTFARPPMQMDLFENNAERRTMNAE